MTMTDFHEEYREIQVLKSNKLTAEVIQQLDQLFDNAEPLQLRDTLIEIYHTYILQEHEMLPANFYEMACHLQALIAFLKLADNERKGL